MDSYTSKRRSGISRMRLMRRPKNSLLQTSFMLRFTLVLKCIITGFLDRLQSHAPSYDHQMTLAKKTTSYTGLHRSASKIHGAGGERRKKEGEIGRRRGSAMKPVSSVP